MKKLPLLLLAAMVLPMVSCETTGDPMSGGLFGWSENKFQQRVAEKERTLYNIESDTARQHRTADGLRYDIRRERGRLNSYQ